MTLIKISSINAIAVIVKLITLLSINKIIAIYVGPGGYALVGQFQNFISIINTLASSASNNGVTKYTAEYANDDNKQRTVWQTAGAIGILLALLISIVIFIYRVELARSILKDENLSLAFGWFAATLIFFVLNTLLLAILNGKKDIINYTISNLIGSIICLIVSLILVIKYEIIGALIALTTYNSLLFIFTMSLCLKEKWFRLSYIFGFIDKKIALNLSKYALMAVVTASTVPVSYIIIRNNLIENLGIQEAGYWEAMLRLSNSYLMVITTSIGFYYLPKISELKNNKKIREEIYKGLYLILPITIFGLIILYFNKEFCIINLFTEEFIPIEKLFFWYLIGDVLKVTSWFFAYYIISKSMVFTYVITEILTSINLIILTTIGIKHFGLVGTSLAHAINYTIYLLIILIIFINKTKK